MCKQLRQWASSLVALVPSDQPDEVFAGDDAAGSSTGKLAGLGSKPVRFEMPILNLRPHTSDHPSSLSRYTTARTTLLGSQPSGPATICNCCTIGSRRGCSAGRKAKLSCRSGPYSRCRASRRPADIKKPLAFPRRWCAALPAKQARQLLRFVARSA